MDLRIKTFTSAAGLADFLLGQDLADRGWSLHAIRESGGGGIPSTRTVVYCRGDSQIHVAITSDTVEITDMNAPDFVPGVVNLALRLWAMGVRGLALANDNL